MPAFPRELAISAWAACAVVVVYLLVTLPNEPIPLLGTRGQRRRQFLLEAPSLRPVIKLLVWLGERADRYLPTPTRISLERTLTAAGEPAGLAPIEFLMAMILVGVASALGMTILALSSGRPVVPYAVLGLGVGFGFPIIRMRGQADERKRLTDYTLPGVMDLLSLGLSAGLDFPNAVQQILKSTGSRRNPVSEELELLLSELRLGKTRSEALKLFAARLDTPLAREFAAAIAQAEIEGTPLATVIERQARISRQRRSARAEEVATRAGLRMIIPLVFAFGSIIIVVAAPLTLKFLEAFNR